MGEWPGRDKMMPFAVQPQHRRRTNATWNTENLSSKFLPYPHQQLGEMKSLCKNMVPKHHRGRKLLGAVRVLRESAHCFLAEMHLGLIIPCQLVWPSMARVRWGGLFAINNLEGLSMVSFCSRTMQHLTAIVMCKIWCNVWTGRCWYILPTLQISPHVITGCLHVRTFWIEDDINVAVTASLHHLSKDEYTPAIDCLPHTWEKYVDSAGDYTE